MMRNPSSRLYRSVARALLLLALLAAPALQAQQPAVQQPARAAAGAVPHPSEVFGFEPGADYELANYTQLLTYYRQLAEASDRVQMIEIGRTTQDRPMVLLFISTAENLRQLDRWRQTAARLALARDLDDAEARRLAREGKAVVWIDSGLHSAEVAHSQHAPLLAHHMATDESEESRMIRENVILLLMPVMNPDGHEIVVDWYLGTVRTPYDFTRPPTLYHEYVDHDINRDWFMLTQAETQAVARVLYHEWFPQIVFNHHQDAPFPARIFIPPFADPVNPNIPPLVVRGTNLVGDHMAKRFEAEGKSGVVARMRFDMWWNGGMRSVPYFHNMVGILSEVGHRWPTPSYHEPDSLPETFGAGREVISTREPSIFYANPWPGGWARIGDAVAYHLTASLGTLDLAARLREEWLYNIYQLGRDAIRRGTEGGPYAYVIPQAQWDAGAAVEMVNVLRRGAVEIHRATSSFTAGGRRYPAGSYIAYTAQPFRAHLVDLMEPQVYPDRRLYPGGPPEPPYDLAGWTLPMQMGVTVERIDAAFQAATEPVDVAPPPPGRVTGNARWGYLLSPRANATATAVNRLLRDGEQVSLASAPFSVGRQRHEAGTMVVRRGEQTHARMETMARELGLEVTGLAAAPRAELRALRTPRIGLYRSWVVNIDEGWMRFVLDEHDFPLENVRDADIRQGDLSRFDVIILPAQRDTELLRGHREGTMPEEYVGGLGPEGAAALRRFVEGGGRVIALDGATDYLIEQLGLPLRNTVAGVSQEEFFIPGSLLRIRLDTSHPLARGMPEETAANFVTRAGSQSRGFEVTAGAAQPVEVVARWAERELLLSGWELGAERYLAGQPVMVRLPMGQGDLVLLGFRAQFRAQPHGTFKLLFNAIHDAPAIGAAPTAATGAGERELVGVGEGEW